MSEWSNPEPGVLNIAIQHMEFQFLHFCVVGVVSSEKGSRNFSSFICPKRLMRVSLISLESMIYFSFSHFMEDDL